MSDEITDLLRRVDPLREDELANALERGRAAGGARRIAATPWPRPARRGRRTLGAALIAALAAIVAVTLSLLLSPSSTPSAEALSFSRQGGYVIARIVNPYASVSELRRELAANRLHVALKLVPASPGSVGKVVMIDVNGSPSSGIQPLQEGKCANGPCTVGVKVARDYKGTGYVVIGRPAKPGERYESTPIRGSFAPGEALHCSGLEGATLKRALAVLHSKGLAVTLRRVASGATASGAGGLSRKVVERRLTLQRRRRAGGLKAERLSRLAREARLMNAVLARRAREGRPGFPVQQDLRVQQISPVAPGVVEVWVAPLRHRSALMPRSAGRPHQLRALQRDQATPGITIAPAKPMPFSGEGCSAGG
jgi:hypothetical protein